MGRKPDFKASGIELAYLVGALCTQLDQITRTPWAFAERDAEITIHLLERARASMAGAHISDDITARIERTVEAVERLVAAGKVTGK